MYSLIIINLHLNWTRDKTKESMKSEDDKNRKTVFNKRW